MTTCLCWPGWLIRKCAHPVTGLIELSLLIPVYNNNFTTKNFSFCSGSRSLAGGDEIAADIDVPEQGETKDDEDLKEDDEVQQQGVDEELHSIQASEGQKVRRKTELLVFDSLRCDIFIPRVHYIECSQSTVEEKQPPPCRRPIKPDTDTDGSTYW